MTEQSAIDYEAIDNVFRLLDREVWIVTAAAGRRRGGLVATWVFQASIDVQRPVVLAAIAPNHFTAELIDRSGAFAAHLLNPRQIELAWNFASGSGRDRDKLAGLDVREGSTGSPILADSLAWLEGKVFARLAAGDRNYYWADVVAGEVVRFGRPMRESDFMGGLTHEQRQWLRDDRQQDAALNRPGADDWRRRLPDVLRLR